MIQFLLLAAQLSATSCEGLQKLSLPDTTITLARVVPAGSIWELPGNGPPPAGIPIATAPASGAPGYYPPERPISVAAHCRVEAVIRPTKDSEIGMQVWLPTSNWNGKFLMVGNGGWAGSLLTPFGALNEGYATASTDSGHRGRSGEFALGHLEKLVDFAYRAVHETAVKSKTLIAEFFGRGPRLSYFDGCSTGGRQALMEAQRYPEDFDGIIAAAPANDMTHLAAWRFSAEKAVLTSQSRAVSESTLALVNRAVLNACDALDGVVDEFLSDPRECKFDPSSLLCRVGDTKGCLTQAQVETVKSGYAPLVTSAGEVLYPGLVPGAEARWAMLSGTETEPGRLNDLDLWKYAVHQDPNWDWRTFDVDRDVRLADQRVGYLNAVDADLSAFKSRGGKLIIRHGWNDGGNGGAISPLASINYYSSVIAKMGPDQDEWLRLFMQPGVAHCFGGPGPHQANWLAALERWRELGEPPDSVVSSRVNINNQVDMTRPVCSYPKTPKYKGSGSTNDAANFVCREP